MLKAILIVVLLLVALCYAALFLTWNGDMRVNLLVWRIGGDPWWLQSVPAGLLPVAGAVAGALVMAFAAWGPWATQRRAAKTAEAKVQKAVEKFNEQKGRLAERNETIQRLQDHIAELEKGPVGTAAEAPPAGPPAADVSLEGSAQPATEPADGL